MGFRRFMEEEYCKGSKTVTENSENSGKGKVRHTVENRCVVVYGESV